MSSAQSINDDLLPRTFLDATTSPTFPIVTLDMETSAPTTFGSGESGEFEASGVWPGLDFLVAAFFLIAILWLIMAIVYSILILCLLRLQERGELDYYDENFGVLVLCGGHIKINASWILRRFAIQLEREQQPPSSAGDPVAPVRIMTRAERRLALQHILKAEAEKSNVCQETLVEEGVVDSVVDPADVCSICLGGYESNTAEVYSSRSCVHKFHEECILDWLERKQNTDCPCCRKELISDDEVWGIVKKMRIENRRKLRSEKNPFRRCLRRILVIRCDGNLTSDDESSSSDDASVSTEAVPCGVESVSDTEAPVTQPATQPATQPTTHPATQPATTTTANETSSADV